MKNDKTRIISVGVKSNARFVCQECGSTELIQAHHQIPKDDSSLITLCADCHSNKHPNVPKSLFFSTNHQPYWENISASSLARELGKHPRTIYRIARKLIIPKGILTDEAKEQIIKTALRRYPRVKPKSKANAPRGILDKETENRIKQVLTHIHQTTGEHIRVTVKWIHGNPYLYQIRSERNGTKVRQVFVRYFGRADGISLETIEQKLNLDKNLTLTTTSATIRI